MACQTTNSFGTQTKAYSPFGELLSEKVSGYGFNGEYFDAATGMLNLRARQYEPAQGRFSQKDSEKGHVANARSLNAYLYCYNDGVNYFDASGATPDSIRNITVDSGAGGSYAERIASTAQSGASANAVASASTNKSANTAAKQSRDAAIREANPEEWARSEEARREAARRATKLTNKERIAKDNPEEMARSEYIRKQERMPSVGDRFNTESYSKYACRRNETEVALEDGKKYDKTPEGYYASLDNAILIWSKENIEETRRDHRERGGMIVSKTINGKDYYTVVKTGTGINGTCWPVFISGYLTYNFSFDTIISEYSVTESVRYEGYTLMGFVHTHTSYPPNGFWNDWNSDDYGPSDADLSLFRLPGISRQFIANERGGVYEFFSDEPKRLLRDFENDGQFDYLFKREK